MTKITKTDYVLFLLAHVAAFESDYPGRRVGCVYADKNGAFLCAGSNHSVVPRWHQCADKLSKKLEMNLRDVIMAGTAHAEQHRIAQSAQTMDTSLFSKAYVTMHPCFPCLYTMSEMTCVKQVYTYAPNMDDVAWRENFEDAIEFAATKDIELVYMPQPDGLGALLKEYRLA